MVYIYGWLHPKCTLKICYTWNIFFFLLWGKIFDKYFVHITCLRFMISWIRKRIFSIRLSPSLSLSVETITFKKILRFKCALVHFIKAQKVKKNSLTSRIRPKFQKLENLKIFKNYFLEISNILILVSYNFHKALQIVLMKFANGTKI